MSEFHCLMLNEVTFLRLHLIENVERLQEREYGSDEHITDNLLTFLRTRISTKVQKTVRRSARNTDGVEEVKNVNANFQGEVFGPSVMESTGFYSEEFESIAPLIQQKIQTESPQAFSLHSSFGMTQNSCLDQASLGPSTTYHNLSKFA